jgi:hypothetical protein
VLLGRSRPTKEGGAVGDTERLVQAEDREVAARADRAGLRLREPGLSGVLEQEEAALVAPRSPPLGGLREAQVVDEHQGAGPRPNEGLELRLHGRQVLVPGEEPAR